MIDGKMRDVETGQPFTLDFIGVSYYSIRQNLSLVDNLRRVGIETSGRSPEVSQWLHRSRTGKFNGDSVRLGPTHTTGAAAAQLVRQCGSRPAVGSELGTGAEPGRRPLDRAHHRREQRRGPLRGNARAGPYPVVELLLHPVGLAAGVPADVLG